MVDWILTADESLNVNDQEDFVITFIRQLDEVAALLDEIRNGPGKVGNESFSITDSITSFYFLKNPNEDILIVDSPSNKPRTMQSESFSIADSFSYLRLLLLLETLGVLDVFIQTVTYIREYDEDFLIFDITPTFVLQWVRALSETVLVEDMVSNGQFLALFETPGVLDEIFKSPGKFSEEFISAIDTFIQTVAYIRLLLEGVQLLDEVKFFNILQTLLREYFSMVLTEEEIREYFKMYMQYNPEARQYFIATFGRQ